jgi:photosystem II biogenesis protein Psp29
MHGGLTFVFFVFAGLSQSTAFRAHRKIEAAEEFVPLAGNRAAVGNKQHSDAAAPQLGTHKNTRPHVSSPLFDAASSDVAEADAATATEIKQKQSSAAARQAGPQRFTDIKTVAQTNADFTRNYNTPIVPAYRSIVMDLLTTNHLMRVDERFTYDPIFALGMVQTFAEFFKAYPGGTDISDKVFVALISAIDLDPEQVKADAAMVLEWAEGKDAAGLEALFDSPDAGPVGSAIAAAKGKKDFLYNRAFGVGMFKLFSDAGIDVIDSDLLAKYAGKIGFSANKFQQDYDLYSESLKKLRSMEQLFKEIEIREKKKLASRLEEKAAKAAAAATEAAAIAAGKIPEEVDDTPRIGDDAKATEQQSAEV